MCNLSGQILGSDKTITIQEHSHENESNHCDDNHLDLLFVNSADDSQMGTARML